MTKHKRQSRQPLKIGRTKIRRTVHVDENTVGGERRQRQISKPGMRAVEQEALESLTRLTRLAQRRAAGEALLRQGLKSRLASVALSALDVAIETGDPIGRVCAVLIAEEEEIAVAVEVGRKLSEPPFQGAWPLRELAVQTFRLWLRDLASKGDETELEAFVNGRLGVELSLLGYLSEAADHLQKAIELYRSPARENQEQLAQCLAHAAENDAILGKPESALIYMEEAIALMRERATEPEGMEHLANGLHSLACRWIDVDRQSCALAAIRESIEFYEKMGPHRDWEIEAEYARSLMTLGNVFRYLERDGDAIGPLKKAIEILRPLQVDRPHHFTPDLALALANFSLAAVHTKDRQAGVDAQLEATRHFETSSSFRERALHDRLAWSRGLRIYARPLADQEFTSPPRQLMEEVESGLDVLAEKEPSAWRPWLADHLESRAARHLEATELDEALGACERGLRLLDELHGLEAGHWQRSRGWLLIMKAATLDQLGRTDESLAVYWDAVSLFSNRPRDAAFFRTDLSGAQLNLALALLTADQLEEARKIASRALDVSRELAADNPGPISWEVLSEALNALGIILHRLGDLHGALEASQEAVILARELHESLAGSFTKNLARTLGNLSIRLHHLEAYEEAAEKLQESIQLFELLRSQGRQPDFDAEAESHFMLGNVWLDLEQPAEAITQFERAYELRRLELAQRPTASRHPLLVTMIGHASALCAAGRGGEALAVCAEALELCSKKERDVNSGHWALPTLWAQIAQARLQSGQCDEAVQAVGRAWDCLQRRVSSSAWREAGSVEASLLETYLEACRLGGLEMDFELLAELATSLLDEP